MQPGFRGWQEKIPTRSEYLYEIEFQNYIQSGMVDFDKKDKEGLQEIFLVSIILNLWLFVVVNYGLLIGLSIFNWIWNG